MDLASMGASALPPPTWRSRLAAMSPDQDAGPQPQNAIGADALANVVSGPLASIGNAFNYFGRTLRGEEPLYDPRTGHPSDEAYGAAGTLAGIGMTGGIGGTGPGGVAVGAGPIRAYHGSPHDFERFDLSKIGTGEGAQAYGHGLYFAENEAVARGYRDQLAHRAVNASTPEGTAYYALQHSGGDRDMAASSLVQRMDEMKRRGWLDEKSSALLSGAIDNIRGGKPLTPGHMYEVGIHADPQRFLDWDKPMTAQPAPVQKALEDLLPLTKLRPDKPARLDQGLRGEPAYRQMESRYGGPQGASDVLAQAGIPGIQYLDAGSRFGGTGSLNRVVFDDKLVEILRKYGLLGPVAGGAAASALPGNDAPPQQ